MRCSFPVKRVYRFILGLNGKLTQAGLAEKLDVKRQFINDMEIGKKQITEKAQMCVGYIVNYKLLDAKYYGIPQDRKRVFIVGYLNKMGKQFLFPDKTHSEKDKIQNTLYGGAEQRKVLVTLKEAIGDLPEPAPAKDKNKTNGDALEIPNHEYMIGGFSTIYMSRNRVRKWDEVSYTIQAGGRHAPCHPQANKMIFVEQDIRVFDSNSPKPYRRLSVRECARIQAFPDDFIFRYENLSDAYKMVGNAVPVKLANILAQQIMVDLREFEKSERLKKRQSEATGSQRS